MVHTPQRSTQSIPHRQREADTQPKRIARTVNGINIIALAALAGRGFSFRNGEKEQFYASFKKFKLCCFHQYHICSISKDKVTHNTSYLKPWLSSTRYAATYLDIFACVAHNIYTTCVSHQCVAHVSTALFVGMFVDARQTHAQVHTNTVRAAPTSIKTSGAHSCTIYYYTHMCYAIYADVPFQRLCAPSSSVLCEVRFDKRGPGNARLLRVARLVRNILPCVLV